ncbi:MULTISPECIES: maltose/maltodextrin ABC transporter substrate-binding protein MalE [Halocynthiibacter]|uniref:Maltodextrin-binding protein n=1 Tax=Halocynthiibacter halioticoli TaxID=2986804 RepID=A0AAE3J2Z1_9RHOB|nr:MULTISPECIES: maltose/maltodextrin ABC transporter substrate-binding protein MalE [Halocynthiibacter]MCV6825833.1 maltose/maltodextrin ABC transporter substrate-binding protein MalE [Halocynthiibacter halioticoli]MCW4058834.1 maltose/maltodextrin ABC transporter substrate-binding protein MalE [Halocynthiibacter sp. SDUM655004]
MKNLMKTLGVTAALMCSASGAFALEEGKITIWMGAGKGNENLQAVADKFTEELGIEVSVEVVDPGLTDKFQQAASTGDGPDIVLWAHDRFGEWAKGGLITPVTPSADFKSGVLDTAWDAVSFDGNIWGYPVSVEAIGLIYNTDLIPTPPASFEELKDIELPEGVNTILWDYNNTYFTFPMLMANGGFAFKKVDGSFDGSTTGVNTDGAIMGGDVLRSLFDDGILPEGVDYGVMDGAMARGETAMVINGPWSWNGYTDAGINIAVAPIPTVNGQVSPPFLGVYSAAINAASPNADLAIELVENYMLTDEGLAEWNAQSALGALADISAGQAQSDPKVGATLANAANGVPMPSNPEMGAFWSSMEPALGNITTGAQAPADALNDAAKRILGE